MDRSRQVTTSFWWRAAEPIPARPEALEPTPDDNPLAGAAAFAAEPPGRVAVPAFTLRADPPAQAPREVDIGKAGAIVRSGSAGAHAGLGRGLEARFRRSTAGAPPAAAEPIASLHRRPKWRPRQRDVVLCGAIAGAVVFSGLTGFGTRVRDASTLASQVDALAMNLGFSINEISVVGLKHTLEADIFRALGPLSTTLAGLDVATARARIEELPWVETATLARIFPDKLKIEIRERVPSAIWLNGDAKALVDANGRVLGHLGAYVPPDLPQIAGDGAPEAAADLFAKLASSVGLRSRIVLARRIGQRRWDLELANGTRVKLAAHDLGGSLARLAELQAESRIAGIGVLDRGGQVIDLTLQERITISNGAGAVKDSAALQVPVGPEAAKPL